jgi:putative nucleotidyltransferase with HDIG domain
MSSFEAFEGRDWRGPDQAAPVVERPVRASAPTLFLRSKQTSLAGERDRARQIVDTAKSTVVGAFDDIKNGKTIRLSDLEPVVMAIAASVARHPTALPSVTRLKDRHEYTYLHSIAVCGLMLALGRTLGLDDRLTREIGLAGLLHDVGKAKVPVELLDRAGPLNLDEYALIQRHTLFGHQLLIESGIDSSIALDVCLHHHERVDGGGYPTGISASTLSIYARMGAVCDVYDAVTSARTYKKSWLPAAALDWMEDQQGHFDPRVLKAFRKVVGNFPVGTLVRLQSGHLAVVLNEPADNPYSPDVGIFLDPATRRDITPYRKSSAVDAIVSVERASRLGLEDWEHRCEALLAQLNPAAPAS